MAQKTKYDPVLRRPVFTNDSPCYYHDARISKQIFVRTKKKDTKKEDKSN